MKIAENIRKRRSVRSYDGRILGEDVKSQLMSYAESIKNPFGLAVEFKLLDGKEKGLVCPVINGCDTFVGGKIKNVPMANVAFGYSFEEFVLYAQSLDVGTVWLGGTMNRAAFEDAMEMAEDEMMPCASPLGYAAPKMSLRETMMRKAIKADERMSFEELFFEGSLDNPLSREKAGAIAQSLEMVRLAPSAVNKQPWRLIVSENAAHFYLKRSKGFTHEGKLDMQQIDIGIALCHFALSEAEQGRNVEFFLSDPGIASASELEYIASYRLSE